MKKYMFLICGIFSILLVVSTSLAKENTFPLFGKVIIVDPGHGANDPGTVYEDVYEKNINLSISQKLKQTLEKYGATVLMTRNGDYDLSTPNAIYRKKSDFDNRIKMINDSEADIYLSIHLNYLNDTSYYGAQVFYENEESLKLAQIMKKVLNSKLKTSREIKMIPNDTYMYKKLNKKGLLIECGFLSNKAEREKLKSTDYQQQIAQAISEGVILYFT